MADESRATPAELTQKQKKFADYLIKLGRDRATEAAKLAGYSEKSARQSGYANMQKASVKAYIEERLKTAAEPKERAEAERKLVADGDEVLRFLSATMRGEVKDQFGLDAQLKDRLAAAKELQRILDVAKPAEQNGGIQTLIIEPIYGAPEADDDGE